MLIHDSQLTIISRSPQGVNVDVLETKTMQQNMVVVRLRDRKVTDHPGPMVAIYGIYFDTGKADIKSESSLARPDGGLPSGRACVQRMRWGTDSVGVRQQPRLCRADGRGSGRPVRTMALPLAGCWAMAWPLWLRVASNTSEEGRAKTDASNCVQ